MPRPSGITHGENTDFFISESVFNALDKMELKMDTDNNELTEICKLYNPHEYVFSNVIDTPVSKLLPTTNLYYELHEIFNTFGMFKTLYKLCQILHVEEELSITPFHSLFNTVNITHCVIDDVSNKSDFIFIDLGVNLIPALDVINQLLNNEGIAIIKLTNIYKKQTISILYLLSIIFEKTFIVKPSVINVLSNNIFIVCINRINKPIIYENQNIMKIVIPAIFLCKIEEFNSVNGHRQLDAYEQIFNLLHNKHRNNKLEMLKKTNIQKSIAWCEKHNIPHNKFGDKINMFL
jgi:predicted transcriptional regulator